jgi:hypothetical protein
MPANYINPKWWQLYLTFPLLIALFILDHHLTLSASGHQVVQIGIILVVYGLVHLWLKANVTALSKMDQKKYHDTNTVIRIPPLQPPDAGKENRSILQISTSEIKGVLNNTFEMEYIDAESFTVDQSMQEFGKE